MSDHMPYEKAIEETARTVGKAIDAGTKLGRFTGSVFGAPLHELAGWTCDVIAARPLRWQANNVDCIMADLEKLRGAGLPVRALPPRQASVVLDAIANEDNADIQQLWAGLLKRATDPSDGYEIKRVHINVLRSIDPPEAKIINTVQKYLVQKSYAKRIDGVGLSQDSGIEDRDLTVYLHHLASLGCFIASDKTVGLRMRQSPDPDVVIETSTADFQFTALLRNLLDLL